LEQWERLSKVIMVAGDGKLLRSPNILSEVANTQ
jgi:hypothetical protein